MHVKNKAEFEAALFELNRFANEKKHTSPNRAVERTEVYNKFIMLPGRETSTCMYDNSKSYAKEIKRLVDLKYNVNLPELLSFQAVTPSGSLPHSTIVNTGMQNSPKVFTGEDFVRKIRNIAFSRFQDIQSLDTFARLELRDVVEIRKTGEWQHYRDALASYLEDPFDLQAFDLTVGTYIRLVERITQYKCTGNVVRWKPAVAITLIIGKAVVKLFFNVDSSDNVYYDLLKDVLTPKQTTGILGVAIGNVFDELDRRGLTNAIEAVKFKALYGEQELEYLIREIQDNPGKYKHIKEAEHLDENDANIVNF